MTLCCKVNSTAAKMARSKYVYQHTMGRRGYANVKQKMIENKETEPDKEPPALYNVVERKGMEKGGYARGVGSGVTYKRYFDLPQSRQASNERIALLQSQLDNERRERHEKELEI
nr:hypothetical protein [Tanacetum cinerariifolium]